MDIKRPIGAAIFDMDGLLLDTEIFYTEATQAIVSRWGHTFDWSLKSNMVGRPAIDSARYLVDALKLPITPEQFLEEREALLMAKFSACAPMPGAVALTHALHGAGIPLAIATSSEGVVFTTKIEPHRLWFAIFSAIVSGDHPDIRAGKPAPDIFLVAARALGVEPERCVVFEDAPSGVAAGKAAGMTVVAIPYPGMDAARLSAADVIVSSMEELSLESFA